MAPPAASPPALKFLVTSFTNTCGTNTITFTATTDVACTLTAHVAEQRPIIRRIPYEKRGADFVLSSVTCFVEIDTITQNEVGDTTTHTFTIPAPVCDKTYYWYLTGTIGGVPATSISQIFWHSCPCPPAPSIVCYATPGTTSPPVQHAICDDIVLCKIKAPVTFTPATYRVYFTYGPWCYPPKQVCLSLWTTLPTGYPGAVIGGPWQFTYNPPNDGQAHYEDVTLTGAPPLTAGQHYEFRAAYCYDGVHPGYWYGLPNQPCSCPPDPGYSALVRYDRTWTPPCCGTITHTWPGLGQQHNPFTLWRIP